MYSKSSILARPGWSPLNFDRLLGEPDEMRRSGRRTPAMLYRSEKILAAEATALFQEIKREYKSNVFGIIKTHILPSDLFADRFGELTIEVVLFTLGRVREGAIGHYNATRTSGFATRASDPSILERIMVQYAKEVLTFYDRDFEEYLKQVGAETALRAIRYTIYRAIGQTYPELSRECLSQYEYPAS